MPGVITALIFTFIAAWNEFVVALTLTTTPVKQPLTVALNSFIGQYQVDWQNLFAGSLIATIPVIILFALIEAEGGQRPHGRIHQVAGTRATQKTVWPNGGRMNRSISRVAGTTVRS